MYYDKYFEEYPDKVTIEKDLKDYLAWCKDHNIWKPEARTLKDINEDNISHVRYHAKLFRGEHP
jgi:uncharacterized protein YktB (UPF0637 family)